MSINNNFNGDPKIQKLPETGDYFEKDSRIRKKEM